MNRLKDRVDSHLLKIMYKRTQNNLYLDPTKGRARLYDGPVRNIYLSQIMKPLGKVYHFMVQPYGTI